MHDVARLAGVSHQTVSRVLNGHPNVSPTTRARVVAAIEELHYSPNIAARALVTGRSRTIGIVTIKTNLFGPTSMLFGLEQAAQEAQYYVSVVSLRALDRGSVRDALRRLAMQSVEGVIVIAPLATAEEGVAALVPELPVVAVEGDPGVEVDAVSVDQDAGAYAATSHLLERGHRQVWHVAGPENWLEARGRLAGWRRALDELAVEAPPHLSGDWSARSGYEAGELLVRMRDLTAVFAANDHMALGLIRAIRESGRRVPEDVSIVGFDDVPEAEYFSPPLTTVKQDFGTLGRRGIDLLLERIEEGRTAVSREMVAPQLIVRESTAALD